MNRAAFYDAIRGSLNLTTENVVGFERLLDYIEKTRVAVNKAAYGLATAFWESAQTMRPVKEAYWLSEAWRRKNLRYYPWYGRGLIQTTWERNYIALAKLLKLPSDTFTKNPDLLLEWQHAIPALFVAMEAGLYTGKSFDDYIDDLDESDDEDLREFIAARRIVNGTDKATQIGKLALALEHGLRKAGYDAQSPAEPDPGPPAPKQPDDPGTPPVEPPEPQTGNFGWIGFAILLAGAAWAVSWVAGLIINHAN